MARSEEPGRWKPPQGGGLVLFGWVRLILWRRSARALLRAPIKLCVIAVAWSVLLGGIYLLMLQAIRFVYDTAGLGPFLLSRLWFLFLFVVMVMLAVSQLSSAYSTLVSAPETRWWMVLPVSPRTICRAKWLESGFYSSWAVAALVMPMSIAYLVVLKKSLWLVGWIVGVLAVPLIGIVTAWSTMLLLVWLRWLGHVVLRREWLPVGFLLVSAALFWLLGERQETGRSDVWFLALQELLPRMQIAMSLWLPSSWVATALDAGLNDRWIESAIYAALLWSTMGLSWRMLDHLAAWLLLPVLRSHGQSEAAAPAQRPGAGGRTVVIRWWMREPFRAALAKDVRLVLRDPTQWSQAVMFFGLLGVYFANIHRVAQMSVEPSWRLGVASLHLACTLLVLASLAVRFVFPQMSMEGRNLWLFRMAPGGMEHLLASKVWLYGAIAMLVMEGLLLLSTGRLEIPPVIRWWLCGVGVVSSLTIVGLTVGLGAWWIDPDAQDPARIVSSSNGALVLVLVLAYVGCVVAALVCAWGSWLGHSLAGLAVASAALLTVSVLAGVVPLVGGLAVLQRLESAS